MSAFTVSFRRTESAGLVSNLWIYHPGNRTEKLIFTADHAASVLDEGALYTLFWLMNGVEGSELQVEMLVHGKDDDFRPLVSSSKIPRDPGSPPGARLTYQDFTPFTI